MRGPLQIDNLDRFCAIASCVGLKNIIDEKKVIEFNKTSTRAVLKVRANFERVNNKTTCTKNPYIFGFFIQIAIFLYN